MIRVGCRSSVVIVGILMSGSAHAQEPGKVGVTMGYPSAVGVIWQASDAIAIRPVITFAGTLSDSTATTSGASNWNVGTTISALFYVKKYDNVRTYVSPSYRYSHTSTTITPSSAVPNVGTIGTTANSNGATGSFGAEYAPVKRVRIYGEVGFSYAHSTTSGSTPSVLNSTGNSWGTTAGVGFVFYP